MGLLLPMAYAKCEYVIGDVVTLPSITTDVVPDADPSDGYLKYLYCSYQLSDKSIIDMEAYNGQCPSEILTTELQLGETNWTTMITSIEATYSTQANGWIPDVPQLIDTTTTSYDTCYPAPDQSFFQSLMQILTTFVCNIFNFGFCTTSPESTIDCDWCNSECVEWQVDETYPDCDRTPVSGKSCVMATVMGRNFCASLTTVPEEGLLTFCTENELLQLAKSYDGDFESLDSYFREHCDGLFFPLDFCPTEYWSYELSDGNGNFLGNDMECRSVCRNNYGSITGGRIVWDLRYNFDTQELITSNPLSVTPYPTEECTQ